MAQAERDARIALLIDADNSPANKIDVILAELAKFGVANIRRAYGNWKKQELKGWENVLHEYAIRPIQQFDISKGKNATDMCIVIDALELLYTDAPAAFGLVSSDGDFTPLVMHLRAKGAEVYGFGAKKTPAPFVNACSRFLFLENLGRGDEPVVLPDADEAVPAKKGRAKGRKAAGEAERASGSGSASAATGALAGALGSAGNGGPTPTNALKQDARLVNLLRHAVENAAGDDGWSRLGAVGKQIANQASFDPRNYGYKKLGDLIEATQLFEIDRSGAQVAVRDKRAARSPRG